ncbi:MarR family winged helix-turn-helix transcriptional regulator [Oceaniglobus indicus]|uniref:MarR family winged helix-turn-helix transcriptional regulator n=1 Tax=Oceaniglobus indicus TaxID=2047749 RepID=UPI000C1780AC|nr:MarR family transcriptional regulator [Oceaniglobus indicus]
MGYEIEVVGVLADERGGVEDLERIISHRVARLHQALSVQATAILSQFDISLSNWRVLSAIWVEDIDSSRKLAEKTGYDPAQISRALHNMRKSGLLELSNNLNDRRILMIEVTPAGRKVLAAMIPHMKARHDALLNALDRHELETFLAVLDKLDAIAELDRNKILTHAGLKAVR